MTETEIKRMFLFNWVYLCIYNDYIAIQKRGHGSILGSHLNLIDYTIKHSKSK